MKATSRCFEQLAHFLRDRKPNVSVQITSRVKPGIQSTEVTNKTDRSDARMLCQMGLERPLTRERRNIVDERAELASRR